jgi:outer membrane protein OmpA-like peptidoglycan-associated protein
VSTRGKWARLQQAQVWGEALVAKRQRQRIRVGLACLLGVVLGLIALPAAAQDRTFYLDRIQVGGAPDDGFATWRPYMSEKTRVYGSATLGYTLNPLRSGTVTDSPEVENNIGNPVRHQLQTYLSIGAEINKRFALNLMLPIGVTEGADDLVLAEQDVGALDRGAAVGDLRAALRMLGYESNDRKFRFGGGGALFLPTGNDLRFASDAKTTAYIYAAAEYDFGSFLLSGTIGPHFRPDRGINERANSTLTVNSELRTSLGGFMFLRNGDLRLGGEIWGTTGVDKDIQGESTFFAAENTSFEWLASGRWSLGKTKQTWVMAGGGTQLSGGYGAPNVRLLGQIGWYTGIAEVKVSSPKARYKAQVEQAPEDKDTDGDGYPDEIDLCPLVAEDKKPPRPDDGCPGISDRDNDGLADDEDRCPDDPEDKDGIQDEDGCPESDADGDGIADVDDACPDKPGVANDNPKKNGCPDKKRKKIVESDGEIKLLEPIQFETAKSTIKEVSFPILDEVVELMKSRSALRVGVYGHTDSRGGRQYNTKLSKERAAAVVKYLTDHGIEKKRLESDGFGPDKPVDTNDTEEGRAKNRRVEFKILDEK